MKKLLVLLLCLSLFSCEQITDKHFISPQFELRQLVKETETIKESSGGVFFLIATYNSSEYNKTTIKVFAKVNNRYRLIEIPIEDIRIAIDNKLIKPNIQIEYTYNEEIESDQLVGIGWINKVYIINCPEAYLPEKLLPINL